MFVSSRRLKLNGKPILRPGSEDQAIRTPVCFEVSSASAVHHYFAGLDRIGLAGSKVGCKRTKTAADRHPESHD